MKAYREKQREGIDSFIITKADHFSFLAHWHINVELVYILEGEMFVGVNENKYQMKKGDLLICGSNEIHYYENNCASILLCVFHPSVIGVSAGWPSRHDYIRSLYIEHKDISKEIKGMLQNLSNYLNVNSLYLEKPDIMIIKGILTMLMGWIEKQYIAEVKDSDDKNSFINRQRMQECITYLEEHYANPITLHEIADHLKVSESTLSHMFRNILGVTLPHYINSVRVYHAKKELKTTDKTMTEIAMDNGFGTVRSFNRAYKMQMGVTPTYTRKYAKVPSLQKSDG